MKRLFFILTLLLYAIGAHAQNKQGNIWYFGRNAGLDFNTEPPTVLTDGKLNTWEGCATIADANGNLLFYTDGIRAWDRNHDQMPNGKSLGGNPSATQSGVIVPYPNNPDLYYLFSVDFQVGALQYALVDMTANGGMGDVVNRNNVLIPYATEKITAVQHANGRDFWVLGHEWNSDRFHTWLISDTGLNITPVISEVGTVQQGSTVTSIGYMKFAPSGQQLALASYSTANFVEIYDFDLSSGSVSNPIKLTDFGGLGPYGIEFSPNGGFLYISEAQGARTKVYQVELPTTGGKIADQGVVLTEGSGFGALQLAPNGKIYHSDDGELQLHVIHKPDEKGILAEYEKNAQDLGGKRAAIGLPTFIQSFFRQISFEAVNLCENDRTEFTLNSTQLSEIDSVVWDFGDPNSGTENTSRLLNPSHNFSGTGGFTVQLTAYFDDRPVLFSDVVNIASLPDASLTEAHALVNGKSLTVNIANDLTASWNDGNTELSRDFNTAGWHWVEVTNAEQCTSRDSMAIFNISYADTCHTTPTQFNLEAGNITVDSLQWQFGDPNSGTNNMVSGTNASHEFTNPGNYTVNLTAYYDGRQYDRNFSLTINALPDAGLPEAVTLIRNASQSVRASNGQTTWDDGNTEPTRNLDSPGWYWVDVTSDEQCTARDSLAVFNITYADTCFNSQASFSLEAGNVGVDSVLWNMGDPNSGTANTTRGAQVNHLFSQVGAFTVNADIYFKGTQTSASFEMNIAPLPPVDLGPDQTLFYGENTTLTAAGTGNAYLWQDGSTEETFLVEEPGTYWAEVTNAAGCIQRDSVVIHYDQLIDVSLPSDTVLCQGETLSLDVSLPDASYRWQDGSNTANYTVSQPGLYWVEITNAFGNRTQRDSIEVRYYDFGELTLDAQVVICEAQTVALTASGAAAGESYRWYDQNMGFLEENQGTYTTSPLNASTEYFVSLTNGRCEGDPAKVTVIYDAVTAEILPSDSVLIGIGETVQLDAFGGDSFTWSPPQWLNTTEGRTVLSTPEDDLQYTVTVTSALGCTDTATVWVLLQKGIFIPNAFSPNGDGDNDTWTIFNLERFPNNLVQIYNRWGSLVFSARGYQNQWDGTMNGTDIPDGNYNYVIDFGDPSMPVRRGTVKLMR